MGAHQRSALLRIPRVSRGRIAVCDVNCAAPTSANPYLAFAVMLAAGREWH